MLIVGDDVALLQLLPSRIVSSESRNCELSFALPCRLIPNPWPPLARLLSFCRSLAAFLKREHGAEVRIFDEAIYAV